MDTARAHSSLSNPEKLHKDKPNQEDTGDHYEADSFNWAALPGLCTPRYAAFCPSAKSGSEPAGQGRSLPGVGDTTPDFTLEDFQGGSFTLSQITDSKAILLWFTNLCKGCELKLPRVDEFYDLFRGKGVEVVAVSQLGEDRETVEDAIRRNKLDFRFLYDPEGEATGRFSGKFIPGTCPIQNLYIIQKDGKIVYASHYPGADKNEIIEHLTKIIGED